MNEITILQQDIELAEALKRLQANKDYQLLIEKMFLDDGAINLTKNITVVKDKDLIVENIKARGYLYRFLMEIADNGVSSIEALKEMENEED